MFTTLPDPPHDRLAHSPLNLVVFHVEFDSEASWGPKVGLQWRDALAGKGLKGKLLGVRQQRVVVQVGTQMASGAPGDLGIKNGHQVQFADGGTAAIYSDSLIVESRNYPGWEAFRSTLDSILSVVETLRVPDISRSINLRYVNALSNPQAESIEFWTRYVQPPFLGLAANPHLAKNFERAFFVASFSDQNGYRAETRIGIQPDAVYAGRLAYVFDTETSQADIQAFETARVLGTADDLHMIGSKIFHEIVTPEYLESVGWAPSA